MADRKITDLTALAAGSQATGDLLTIVDVSEAAATDKNKKITVESLFKGIPSNVGIGTSSPLALYRSLSIHGPANDQGGVLDLATANQSSRAYVFNDSSGLSVQTATSHPILFKPNSTERLRIDSSGVITTDSGHTTARLNVVNGSTVSTYDKMLLLRSNNLSNAVLGLGSDSFHISSLSNAPIVFHTNSDGGTSGSAVPSNERMRIDSSGNVGIGTSSPGTSKLYVLGDTTNYGVETEAPSGYGSLTLQQTSGNSMSLGMISNNLFVYDNNAAATRVTLDSSGRVLINDTAAATADSFLTVKNGSGACEVNIMSGPTSASVINLGDTGDYNIGRIKYDQTTNSLQFNTNNSERMRILSGGGLTFNGDTAAANALDDYEEGTWTPTLSWGGTSATLSAGTYGYYTKIGNTVLIQFRISQTARNTPSGNALMGGLPFAEGAATFNHGMVQGDAGINMPSGAGSIMMFINNTTSRWLYQTNTNHADLVSSQCADGTTFYGFATYRT